MLQMCLHYTLQQKCNDLILHNIIFSNRVDCLSLPRNAINNSNSFLNFSKIPTEIRAGTLDISVCTMKSYTTPVVLNYCSLHILIRDTLM